MANMIILIGGPGLYEACDRSHDKTWLNYFYPMQVAVQKNLIKRGSDTVHWVIYEPAYRDRWLEDSEITFWENAYESVTGRELHEVRKGHADKVITKGSKNYLERIKDVARQLNIKYKGISAPQDFWKYLASFPGNSISRVWYSGHATTKGLILKVGHASALPFMKCPATWSDATTILVTEITKNKHLKSRFTGNSAGPSRFYGCNTNKFAETWHKEFGSQTEGAGSSITFKDIFKSKEKILDRLQTTPTPQGNPNWTCFPGPCKKP